MRSTKKDLHDAYRSKTSHGSSLARWLIAVWGVGGELREGFKLFLFAQLAFVQSRRHLQDNVERRGWWPLRKSDRLESRPE